ncbi:GNAT family N-acetyltransferase [Pseudomonas sp.]|uniref:GNAT family N-acetyltransferase n=1 Tax=Pseudomonas sp. TaxID=306 RepID=UPI001B0CEAFA|nr:GNAT family N-acetyltransferase [Pseudomonas sp.]MBO9551327.1 GNAT family N-acetyltransferase [Pseudomonas sp.]
MNALHCTLLTGPERRLLEHFYKQQGSRMRAANDGESWVARSDGIVAGLCLSAVADGHWLTGLFVAPQQRKRGIAAQLVEAALAGHSGPTWLFCHPDLTAYYQRLGFSITEQLPEALASRLQRYQRSKNLLAMVRAQSSLSCNPGNSTSV